MQKFNSMKLQDIEDILKDIRLFPARLESDVVEEIKKRLTSAGIRCIKEFKIAARSRVDLWVEDGIVIEVKKGKPNTKLVSRQIERYAASEKVKAIILVSERGLVRHIEEANGKPVRYIALSKNWGITT